MQNKETMKGIAKSKECADFANSIHAALSKFMDGTIGKGFESDQVAAVAQVVIGEMAILLIGCFHPDERDQSHYEFLDFIDELYKQTDFDKEIEKAKAAGPCNDPGCPYCVENKNGEGYAH
jgi:hypothetical protein